MNEHMQIDNTAHRENEIKLARWLQHVLTPTPQEKRSPSSPGATIHQSEFLLTNDYHPHFYQQLPDFIMALLQNDPHATLRYAPLLYHLVGCTVCHTAYLELYDAMRYAIETPEVHPVVNQGTRPLATIPAITLVRLCQLLISQAEAVLRQARHDLTDGDALARSLLQFAMRVSTQITQVGMRPRALHDLVRVATLFDGPHSPGEQPPATHSYSPLLGASRTSRRGKKLRRAETPTRSAEKSVEPPAIYLQSHSVEGTVTQNEDTLQLHLEDLDEQLRGKHLIISVPLGSLIEPVRWEGGDPRSIRTIVPVARDGTLTTPLGQTTLRLSDPDDRSLLEVMFLRLEVRPDR
jgi:hypothetical protein